MHLAFNWQNQIVYPAMERNIKNSIKIIKKNSCENDSINCIYRTDIATSTVNLMDRKFNLKIQSNGRRHALTLEQFQQNLSFQHRLRLVLLHYFRSDQIIRYGFIFGCIILFAINSITILINYLKFDTNVYVEYENPWQTRPPGITLCTHCIYCNL